MNPIDIIEYFYPQDTVLRKLLIRHSEQVRDKALQIAKYNKHMKLDREILVNGAMLHDIGIGKCKAKDIFCLGSEPYIKHGVLGAEMLRAYGKEHGLDLEVYARICERHTGSGLTAAEIREGRLPLPDADFLPETPEEKVICLADKFYSKSGNGKEKKLKRVVRSMEKFGDGPVQRFLVLCREFHMQKIPAVLTAFMIALIMISCDIVFLCLPFGINAVWNHFTWRLMVFFWGEVLFLLYFFFRMLYFYFKNLLLVRDIWIYESIFLIFLSVGFFIYFYPVIRF